MARGRKRADGVPIRSAARRLAALGGLAALALPELVRAQEVFPPKVPDFPNQPGPVRVVDPALMRLRVRRVRDAVEVVIENTGAGPLLEQSTQGTSWVGRLYTARPSALPGGSQELGVPEAGLQSISIQGGGTIYNLRITPVAGYGVMRPLVSADGRDLVLSFPAPMQPSLQTMRSNSLAPGAVATPNVVPPLRQRAAAPPVGDMAVGTMLLRNPNYLNVSGPRVTLTFRGVRASDALQALARIGGYGFVYNTKNVQETITAKSFYQSGTGVSADQTTTSRPSNEIVSPPVTASFVNEEYSRALEMILASTGLQAKLVENRTIFAGPDVLSSSVGNVASKVYRLNQVSSKSAAEYLASLGAVIRVPNTLKQTESQGTSTNTGGGATSGGQTSSATSMMSSTSTLIQSFGGGGGPLAGLTGTTDARLSTITLVGPPSLVSIGEQYLRQMDLRQRQVALSIRIMDVSLGNDKSIDNSFAFRAGNNFIVNDSGQFVGAFGGLLPPSTNPQDSSAFDRAVPRNFSFEIDPTTGQITSDIRPGFNAIGGAALDAIRAQPDATLFRGATPRNQGLLYPNNNFYDFVRAQITSRSTKVLASPTLILSENSEELVGGEGGGSIASSNLLSQSSTNSIVPSIGRKRANESAVVVGEQVITSYTVQAGQNGAPNTCQPEFGIAGLTFGARVSKIDDNGFVTFSLSPAISASTSRQLVEGCGFIDILNIRSLDTGNARVRDGQTLILTGVLSDRDLEEVTKWPVLGDLPIVGQFFRQSRGGREKRELVVMVTPRIINDVEGGSYGYGFEPSSRETRQFMNVSPSSAMPPVFPQR